MSEQLHREAETCIEQIVHGTDASKRKAARRLSQIGIAINRGTLPRGTTDQAASISLIDPERQQSLLSAMHQTQSETRHEIIRALANLGGADAVDPISTLLRSPSGIDLDTAHACIHALQMIGGRDAAKTLRWAVHHPDRLVRQAAEWAYDELATGGTLDDTEGMAHLPGFTKGRSSGDANRGPPGSQSQGDATKTGTAASGQKKI